jgi:hypothetical protein
MDPDHCQSLDLWAATASIKLDGCEAWCFKDAGSRSHRNMFWAAHVSILTMTDQRFVSPVPTLKGR